MLRSRRLHAPRRLWVIWSRGWTGKITTTTHRLPRAPGGKPGAGPRWARSLAAINPGNSGGALVDLQGQLLGIPTLAAQDPEQGGPAQGIGFAIPSNRVRFITDQIIRTGKVVNSGRAYLGILPIDVTPQAQAQYGLPVDHGVLAYSTASGGPAAKAGLKQGDIIVRINGHAVSSSADLLTALSSMRPGQKVTLQVIDPNGKKRTVTVTLGTLPVPSTAPTSPGHLALGGRGRYRHVGEEAGCTPTSSRRRHYGAWYGPRLMNRPRALAPT